MGPRPDPSVPTANQVRVTKVEITKHRPHFGTASSAEGPFGRVLSRRQESVAPSKKGGPLVRAKTLRLTAPEGDTLTPKDMNVTTLAGMGANFTFHARRAQAGNRGRQN